MNTPLRVLVVEDSEDDAALLVRELQRGGHEATVRRVETPEAMNAALDAEQWDVVIADYVLPRFSALAALVILRKRGMDLPFIIVSGSIGPGIAAAAVKAGAHDYFMKGETGRLSAAVARVMHEAGERRERRQTEQDAANVASAAS